MTKFIFDLDGTITKEETLPLIASNFKSDVEGELDKLTMDTIKGNIPFIESFIIRVHILGKLPVDEISNLLANVSLYSKVSEFISLNKDNCVVATGNLNCWIEKLCSKIGCQYYCSNAITENNKVKKISKILKKENIVELYKAKNERVVFIGDGNNDAEAMRIADIAIASGLTHKPATSVLSVANYSVYTEEALCRLLNQLL